MARSISWRSFSLTSPVTASEPASISSRRDDSCGASVRNRASPVKLRMAMVGLWPKAESRPTSGRPHLEPALARHPVRRTARSFRPYSWVDAISGPSLHRPDLQIALQIGNGRLSSRPLTWSSPRSLRTIGLVTTRPAPNRMRDKPPSRNRVSLVSCWVRVRFDPSESLLPLPYRLLFDSDVTLQSPPLELCGFPAKCFRPAPPPCPPRGPLRRRQWRSIPSVLLPQTRAFPARSPPAGSARCNHPWTAPSAARAWDSSREWPRRRSARRCRRGRRGSISMV